MAAWKKITLLPNLFSRLEGNVRCERCNDLLAVGKKAWAHQCPRKGQSYTEYYCLLCYPKLWIR